MKEIKNHPISKETVFKQARRQWYVQAFNGTPFVVIPPGAWSAFDVGETLGTEFKDALFEFKEETAKMFYPQDDLNRMSQIILIRLKNDKNFFKNVRDKYEKDFKKTFTDFVGKQTPEMFQKQLPALSNSELVALIKKGMNVARFSVGQGHIIEPFSLTTDKQIQDLLAKHISNEKTRNEAYSILTTPAEKSFMVEREEDLARIVNIQEKSKRTKAIEEHIKKYFWIKNSFSGRIDLTVAMVEEELATLAAHKSGTAPDIKKQQQVIIKQYNLSSELQILLEATRFVALFQDGRKKNMLISLHYNEMLVEELSKRLKISHGLLRYLSCYEFDEFVFEDKTLKKKLEERRKGLINYTTPDGEALLTGNEYKEFLKEMQKADHHTTDINELPGLCASPGTAQGRVRVCLSVKAIHDFKQGEVLVASMTKPEYLPAMKKACAIVTDEGGITSHAAIVSREFGIPCLIGTKIATKVLKDGMLVEVKANHGKVVIKNQKTL